jgi:hypothetical protein
MEIQDLGLYWKPGSRRGIRRNLEWEKIGPKFHKIGSFKSEI